MRVLRWGPGRAVARGASIAAATVLVIGVVGCEQGRNRSEPSPASAVAQEASNCSSPQQQPDQGNAHKNDLALVYPVRPATSGPHYPVPLPPLPAVYDSPVPEARAVHNLEHGYVVVYYQPAGDDALPGPVLEAVRLAVPSQRRTLLAPYPALPAGVALELTAWRVAQVCPRQVTGDQAKQVLIAFVARYRDSPTAPEPGAP